MLLTALAAACGRDAPGDGVALPYPDAAPPRVVEAGEHPLREYPTPRESLLVRPGPPPSGAGLLFFRGRGVARDAGGRGYLPQESGSRILVVGPALRVERSVGGPSPESGGLGLPLSVAATGPGGAFVVDVEHEEGLLYFDADGAYRGASEPPVANPSLAASPDGTLWAARSPYLLGFDPTPVGAPLLWRFDPLAGTGSAIAQIEPAAEARLNRLANAGPLAAGSDGTGFFAFLLRNEIRAYAPDGALRWRSRRALGRPDVEPALGGAGDGFQGLRVGPVTQALAIGPDGLLYSLTAAGPVGADRALPGDGAAGTGDEGPSRRRLEVWDPEDGALLRAATVPPSWTSFSADAEGRVFRVDELAVLRSAPPPERRPLPEIVLETFGGDSVSFADYRGKALLVNVWASWCIPCREELPQLAALYRRLDRTRVEFLAISDDESESAAREFAASFDLPFPLFLGRGSMQESFRFEGLPYTAIVDYRGRIVDEFLGFGSEESWRRLTETLATEIERAVPEGAEGGEPRGAHRHGHPPPSP